MDLEWDVVVVGGGPAGIGAAVAAARNGARTLLVERANCLGGMFTSGLVHTIRTAGDEGGVVCELRERLRQMDAAQITPTHAFLNPVAARVAALELVLAAGARLLLYTVAAGVELEGKTVVGVRLANKAGLQDIRCRIAVDATGDGDLAAWAGAPYDKGRPADGALQAVSLNFMIGGIDFNQLPPAEEFHCITADALRKGELELPPPNDRLAYGSQLDSMPAGVVRFQYDLARGVDGTDPESLTQGEIICQQRVLKIWQYLRRTFAAYQKSVLLDIASAMGVRETRRIRGEKTLTEEDVLKARKHPDGVARCSWYMDLHDEEPHGPEHKKALSVPEGDFYEIPYGCLVPLGVENLLVAGRCISSTRPANGSLRLQPTCMNLGQAAGTAAALCVKRRLQPRALAGEELRSILREQGVEI